MFKRLLLSTLLLSAAGNIVCQEKQEKISQSERIKESLLLFGGGTFIANFFMSFEDMLHLLESDLPSFIQFQEKLNTWITSQNFTAEQMKNFFIENPYIIDILKQPKYSALWKPRRLLIASAFGIMFAITAYIASSNKEKHDVC